MRKAISGDLKIFFANMRGDRASLQPAPWHNLCGPKIGKLRRQTESNKGAA